MMASFERVYPVRLSSLCRHLVGTGRVTLTDEKDELVEYSSWYGVVYCVLMFELLLAGPLFRRRGLCREKQLLLRFSRGRSRQLKLNRASLAKQVAESAGPLFSVCRSSAYRSTCKLLDLKSPAPIPDHGLFCARPVSNATGLGISLPEEPGGKIRLLFVNSLAKSFSVSRAPCATDISWLVTGLVTVNGNRELCPELASFLDAMGSAELFRAADFSDYRPN